MGTPEEHSSLGPSGWDGFVRCPGKPQAEHGLPDKTIFEAAEGTVFHEMVSDCLTYAMEPDDFLGGKFSQDGFSIEIDDEMVEASREGLDYVRAVSRQSGVRLFVETRVDISDWTLPGQFGTSDVVLVDVERRHIVVFDWKYGKVPVYAEENYQAQGYCLGAWKTLCSSLFDDDPTDVKVTLVIEQPRVPGAGGSWDTSMSRVLEFGQHVRRQALRSAQPDPPRVPGTKQCRWCRARQTCPALAAWHMENVGLALDDLDLDDVEELPSLPENVTPEMRSFILEMAPSIRQWLEDLRERAYQDAQKGRDVPGMKLVAGRRPARKWKESYRHKAQAALVDMLGEKAHKEKEIISPAQAEKVLRTRFSRVSAMVDEGDPRPVLVSDKDRREALASVVDEFETL